MAERSGILNWMIEGRRNMPVKFKTPASSSELVESIDRLGAPVKAFVTDRCVIDPGASCTKEELHAAYSQWHIDSAQPAQMRLSKERFSSKLLEAFGNIVRSKQPPQKKGEARRPARIWTGIRVMSAAEGAEFKPQTLDDIPF